MEKYDYKIVLDEVPRSANNPDDTFEGRGYELKRASGASLVKYKKHWEKKLKFYRIENDLPSFDKQKVEIKFKFYHPKNRKRDHDNYFIAMKGMIDGLFKNDDSQWVVCNFPDLLVDPKEPRTEIYIKLL